MSIIVYRGEVRGGHVGGGLRGGVWGVRGEREERRGRRHANYKESGEVGRYYEKHGYEV